MAGQAEASSSCNYYNTTAGSSKTYDVFLNFRGEDTRRNFTGHLHRALTRERIRVFMDSYELWEGEDIGSKLLDSIQGSKISIPVFSKGYAASKWCLKELVKILECRTSNNQIVLPIFFDVDPSDVRHQNGSFKEAFLEHEKNFDLHIVQLWREALTKIGSLKGWVLSEIENGNESKLVELVVERALSEAVNIPFTDVYKYHVGVDSRVNDLQSLLNINFGDVQYIGICGIGGIGKTTIAKILYYQIIRSFRQGCFLPNIREEASRVNGLVSLQEKLILSVSKRKVHGEILSVDDGKQMIKGRLHGENVLLILDDVDHRSQLDAFALDLNWLGRGSTIIITTRDESILNMANIAKDRVYWPTELDDDQSLQFFSLCVFQKIKPFEDYMELSRAVVSYSGGLPLTLKVLGSYLSSERNKEVWESTIEQLRLCAPNEVFERLKISYDNLENDYQKAIFLDSACFFVGWDRETVISIWEACGFYPRSAITRLIQRSLLNFEYDEDGGCYLRMHDQIQSMGKEIVLKESFRVPGNRSRLWSHDEILEVLEGNRGTNKIEGIVLPTGIPMTLASKHFEMMSNLRLLNINSKSFIGDFWCLPYALRWFRWNTCSWDYLPSNFYHKRLTNLNLSFSMIKQTWISNPEEENKFQNLRVLNLSNCGDLQQFPSFLWFPCLEKLDLGYCRNLYKLDESMGELIQLKSLNLESCDSLEELPSTIGNLKSLVELKLRNVTKIVTLPSGVGRLEKLEELDAFGCRALLRLPVTSRLQNLRRLYINNCKSLQQIPGVERAKFFEILDATDCYQLTLPARKILGQGSLLIGRLDEFSYSLTANDGMSHKELVLCIVFESKPNLFASWKACSLTFAGREVLIKSVLQPISNYHMQCFRFPKTICQQVDSICQKFWLGHPNKQRHMTLVAWKKCCQPKAQGGLGFKKMEDVNSALLLKQGWRLLSEPNTLWAKTLKAKYFPKTSIFHPKVRKKNGSWPWKSICSILPPLQQMVRREIGNGRDTSFWYDPWPQHSPTIAEQNPEEDIWNSDVSVAQMTQYVQMNREYLASLNNFNSIFNHIQLSDSEDKWISNISTNGKFTAKLATKALMKNTYPNPASEFSKWWIFLWKLPIHPKLKSFFWRLLNAGLPVKSYLSKWTDIDSTCDLCGTTQETVWHVFISCEWTKRIWAAGQLGLRTELIRHTSLLHWCNMITNDPQLGEATRRWFLSIFIITCYAIWLERNNCCFNKKKPNPHSTLEFIKKRTLELKLEPVDTQREQQQHLNPISIQSTNQPSDTYIFHLQTLMCAGVQYPHQARAGWTAGIGRMKDIKIIAEGSLEEGDEVLATLMGIWNGLQLAQQHNATIQEIWCNQQPVTNWLANPKNQAWPIHYTSILVKILLLSKNATFCNFKSTTQLETFTSTTTRTLEANHLAGSIRERNCNILVNQ